MLKNIQLKRTHFLALIFIVILILILLKIIVLKFPHVVPTAEAFVQSYGLMGGILVAFVGSFWFVPFPYEIVLAPFIKLHPLPLLAVFIFAFAATAADLINFFTGRKFGRIFIEAKIKKKTLDKIHRFLKQWGILTLFIFGVLGPVTSYDIVTFVMGGFSEMKFKTFAGITLLCRTIHFTVVLLLANVLLKISGISL